MKIKRVLAILLCMSLLIVPAVGCRSNEDDGYLHENGTDNPPPDSTPAPSSEDSDPLEEAEEILRLLNEQIGSDNFVEFFRDMMFEHSEDMGGLLSFPDGYLFREGDMVLEFYEVTKGLNIGEISGIVETMYGYHIILKLPVNYDSVPIELSGSGDPPSLRLLAALDDFRLRHSEWSDAVRAELEYSPEFEALDFASVFGSEYDFDTSFSALTPDTVMMSSGDLSISWAHFYVFLFPIVTSIIFSNESANTDVDWHEEDNAGYTLAERVMEDASEEAISFLTYMYSIQVNNIVLSEDDLQILDERIESILDHYDGIENLEEELRNNSGYYNLEIFTDFLTLITGIDILFDTLYGEDGSEVSDELVAAYVELNGYLMAMHILRMKPGF